MGIQWLYRFQINQLNWKKSNANQFKITIAQRFNNKIIFSYWEALKMHFPLQRKNNSPSYSKYNVGSLIKFTKLKKHFMFQSHRLFIKIYIQSYWSDNNYLPMLVVDVCLKSSLKKNFIRSSVCPCPTLISFWNQFMNKIYLDMQKRALVSCALPKRPRLNIFCTRIHIVWYAIIIMVKYDLNTTITQWQYWVALKIFFRKFFLSLLLS